MNRITASFARWEAQIADRIAQGKTTAAAVKKTGKAMDMDIMEHAKFQNLKSLAILHNKLTVEEGQAIYVALGETVTKFNKQPAHVKVALTSLFKELLEMRFGQ